MFKNAAAGLALASLISAAPAKADMFDNVPEYSLTSNSSAYVEQTEESLAQHEARGIRESPSLERDIFEMPDLQINNNEGITIEDYLNSQGIEPSYQFTTEWWEYPINIVGSYVLTVAWHEFAHYTIANILDFDNVQMHGPDFDLMLPAYVTMSRGNHGQLQRSLVSAAGVGFTTFGNIALTSLLKNDALPDWARSFAATASLGMMLDRHYYIWSSTIRHWAGLESQGDDIANLINMNFSSPEAREAAYGVLIAASAIELALRWKELWYLINTAVGKQAEVPDGLGIMPGLYPYGSNVMLGASGEF